MSRSRLFKSQLKQEFQNKGSALIKVTESSLLVGIAATEAALFHAAPPIALIPVGAGLAIGAIASGGLFTKVVIDTITRKPVQDSTISKAIIDLEYLKTNNLIDKLTSTFLEKIKHAKSKSSKDLVKKLSHTSSNEERFDKILEYISAPGRSGGGYANNGKKTFRRLIDVINNVKINAASERLPNRQVAP